MAKLNFASISNQYKEYNSNLKKKYFNYIYLLLISDHFTKSNQSWESIREVVISDSCMNPFRVRMMIEYAYLTLVLL